MIQKQSNKKICEFAVWIRTQLTQIDLYAFYLSHRANKGINDQINNYVSTIL